MKKKVAIVSGGWGQNIGNAFFNIGVNEFSRKYSQSIELSSFKISQDIGYLISDVIPGMI
ncbi:MAG: hypothetical protein KAR13_04445 [Desulfobulbaceae bacterium]|nr:hypothetical protein [Desulfobulbaceae bacterium]